MADLIKLGEKLAKEGPHKKEATPRRVRGLFAGEWIFDTLKAVYVWEHPYYPYFYISHSEFKKDVLKVLPESQEHKDSNTKGFHLARLEAGSQFTSRVLLFNTPSLDNLIRIEHSAITWFSEDEHLLGPHPKDPYKRVETLPSSRTIRIEFDGTVVAESSQNVFLFETMLRPRYYLNPGNVKWELLEESETVSYCPYKGMANYYNLKVNGKETKDAVWYYKYPTAESAPIAGRLCFYNEKVDVFIDGIPEEKYTDARL
ncbi:uncharacterized protein PAC_02625 [Phialocephala subalpina]|uniref:DUF427 domain-containing protein n=1 Tax=Phialocephala subalpina TaxID=576137 RepID=A0A1L7WJ33_9HELO|nr:uncharacterized protein PAC_02625 [Phialocephala subalpina]